MRSKSSCIFGVVRTVPSRSYDQPWYGQTSRARHTPLSSATTRRAPVAADVVERVHRSVLAPDTITLSPARSKRTNCPRRGDLRLVAHEPPSGPPEPLDLEREVLGIDVLVPFEAELRKLGDRDLDSHEKRTSVVRAGVVANPTHGSRHAAGRGIA